jgi:hypothetical protein
MFEKFVHWWAARQTVKAYKKMHEEGSDLQKQLFNTNKLLTTPASTDFWMTQGTEDPHTLTFAGNGEQIFSVDANGNAIWHKPESYDEAAQIFLDSVNWKIEDAAGIRESRRDWEERMVKAIVSKAEKSGSLTAKELTDVVKKCIMYDRLKGTAT